MGQFKPMVKMTTTEPSVILKLKKGGKVAPVAAKMAASPVAPLSAPAEAGKAPKKPSMAQRMKAMNPNQYAKGGNVGGKQMGGMMAPAMAARARPARPMAAPVNPMTRAALGAMAPDQRASRAAMVRKALTGMKKGGSADCSALERELKHHESLSAAKAHKASGGEIDAAETKTTLKGGVAPYAKTKMDTSHKDGAHGTGEVKMGKPAGYKHGGKMVHKAMGGSIMGNEGPYEKTKMVGAGKGKSGGTTGGVRMGNGGGYAAGGVACKADGGTIKAAEIRPANTSKPGKTNTTTGEVKLGNAGGFKHGGSLGKAYATGGNVVDDGKAEKMPRRPVHPPVANTMQSGTYKRGGKVYKADGGPLDDDKGDDRPAPPQRPARPPDNPQYSEVAVNKAIASSNRAGRKISGREAKAIHRLLKGRYNGGGKVSDADMPDEAKLQAHLDRNERALKAWEQSQKEEAEATRNLIPNMARKAVGVVKGMFGSKPPPGSVTKTEKSVTVAPGASAVARKRGGKC